MAIMETLAMDDVVHILRQHGDNPSSFLVLNSRTEYFTKTDMGAVIAFRTHGRYRIQFGGVFGDPARHRELLSDFLVDSQKTKKKVIAIQLQKNDLDAYNANNFVVNQVGASYAVELTGYTLRGKRFISLRNKVSRAQRAGLQVGEVDYDIQKELIEKIDRPWLKSKGRHVKELEFLVGEMGGAAQSHRRLFVGRIDGEPIGYVSYSPVYGQRSGWLHDLSRRTPSAPPGVMEAINLHALTQFQSEKQDWLHFGFTPFSGLDPSFESNSASNIATKVIRLLAEHGAAIYPSQTQVDYKMKWLPNTILPEYIAFHKSVSLGAIINLLRLTKSI